MIEVTISVPMIDGIATAAILPGGMGARMLAWNAPESGGWDEEVGDTIATVVTSSVVVTGEAEPLAT